MSKAAIEFCNLYETLTERQKKHVGVVIAGMKLAKKDPCELTGKEKRIVSVFSQAMRIVRKKTAELQLETVNNQTI